jgi:DNA primase
MDKWMEDLHAPTSKGPEVLDPVLMPDRFTWLKDLSHIADNPALQYLHNRGLTNQQISDWGISVSSDNAFFGRIVLPDPFFTFNDEGQMLTEYWVARTILPDAKPPYLNPPETSARLRVFNLKRERQFTVICEGVFDVYGTGEHAVCLYGKNCSSFQLDRLLREGTPPFYVALDNDAIVYKGQRRGKAIVRPGAALALCESLFAAGQEVYLVHLPVGQDPGDLGRDTMFRLCETALLYDPTVRLKLVNDVARIWI